MKLYEIAFRYRQLMDIIDDNGGEIAPFVQEELDAVDEDLARKSDSICCLIREARYEAEANKEEENRFRARKQAAENRMNSLRNYLFHHLEVMGVDSLKTDRFTVYKGESSKPKVKWIGRGDIPEEYSRFVRYLDYNKVCEDAASGSLPEGFEVTYTKYPVIR